MSPSVALVEQQMPYPLEFLHIVQRLKTTKRSGWLNYGIDGSGRTKTACCVF